MAPTTKSTVAVIQARMGSTRTPGKVLKEFCGQPMLWHQIQRVKLAKPLSKIIVATTNQPEDQAIVELAKSAGVAWSTGSTDDVLDRVYQAAKDSNAEVVVRITGDCPLIDPTVIDKVVGHYLANIDELDHVFLGPDWPEGYDTEAFSFSVLERAWKEASKEYEREHVTPYVTLSGKFRVHRLPSPQNLSHLRLTVDEPEDYEVVKNIYEALYPQYGHRFGLSEILDLYSSQPHIFTPNMEIQRNEGFLNSLKNQRRVLRYDPKPNLTRTNGTWRRAEKIIPVGTQILSEGPLQFDHSITPKYLQNGLGSKVWDVDGNEYIDYPMGLGSVILGHSYPRINEAIRKQLENGTSFALRHPLEVELAELLTSVVPWADMARFGKSGSDATTGAVRAARAFTGREMVLHCDSHGWHDWYIDGTTRNKGVPQGSIDLQAEFAYNDLDAVTSLFEQHQGKIAVVIMEPYRTTPPEPGFFEGVKKLTHDNNAVLIYDEVASGFRFQLGGIGDMYGVTPDLACFGKAIGNGIPISVIAGTKEIMKEFDEIFDSFPSGSECLSLSASIATINELTEKPVYSHIWQMGNRLKDGYNRIAWDLKLEEHTQMVGLPPLTVPTFLDQNGNPSLLVKSLFQQEVLKRGVLFGPAHCISYSHSEEDIDMTLAAYLEALEILKIALDAGDLESRLDGPPIQQVFRLQL